jgi:hypothetical protein
MAVLATFPHLYSLLDGKVANAALISQPEEGLATNHLLDIMSTLYYGCAHANIQS